MEDYASFFSHITGYSPYPYQKRCSDVLLEGKNLLLRAPTGSGKTLGVTIPHLFRNRENNVTRRMIYSVPLRTLTLGIHSQLESVFPEIIFHSGDHSVDPLFESKEIVTTIDQTLASYLSFPYGTYKRQRNITRGALVGANMIFDEFHLFDTDKLCFSTLEMLQRLSPVVQFAIMSATLSDKALDYLTSILNAEVVDITSDELRAIDQSSKKYVECRSCPMDADEILSRDGRSIVICNTVDRSQKIYNELVSRKNATLKDHQIFLLHSRFIAEDRRSKEHILLELFGKNSNEDTNAVLVATQTIEAGLDITCRYLYTDLAPINTLVQRFGRCARFPAEVGYVFVHEILDSSLKRYIAPYRRYKTIIDRTWKELQTISVLNASSEIALVNDIFGDYDNEQFGSIIKRLKSERKTLEKNVLFSHHRSHQRKYIRNIISTNVAVSTPSDYTIPRETVSISPFILKYKLQQMEKEGDLWGYIRNYDSDEKKYIYTPFNSADQLNEYPYHIILFNDIVSYTKEAGLEIGYGAGGITPPKEREIVPLTHYKYDCETFHFHSIEAYKCVWELTDHSEILTTLAKVYNISVSVLKKAIEYMTKLHDLGKLNTEWQRHIKKVQKKHNPHHPAYRSGDYLSRATYDSRIHTYERGIGHAREGGYLALRYLSQYPLGSDEISKDLEVLISYAIMTHHTSSKRVGIKNLSDIELPDDMISIFDRLSLSPPEYKKRYANYEYERVIEKIQQKINSIRITYFPLLIYLQRILRLSDFRSIGEGI